MLRSEFSYLKIKRASGVKAHCFMEQQQQALF